MAQQFENQVQATGGSEDEDFDDVGTASGQVQVVGVDEILDDIDAILETNAEAFVQGFVQKGGQ